ncbi:hypothetical protein D9M68_541660 [compost metagenome]
MDAGRNAREAAVALEGRTRHVDRERHGIVERLEAAVVAAGLGEFEQAALGIFDLALRRHVERRVIGDIDHVLADRDQRAAKSEVVDRPAVVFRVDDRHGFGSETRKVLRDGQVADLFVGLEEGLDGDGVRGLAHADDVTGNLEDLAVQRLVQMHGLQEVRDAIEGVVVDEDRAEQSLFGFKVVRRLAIVLVRLILADRG